MKAWWYSYLAWLVKMTNRERLVVTVCICVVTWFVFDTFFISPYLKSIHTFKDLAASRQNDLTNAQTQLDNIQNGKMPIGDPSLHARLAKIQSDKNKLDASLRANQNDLVAPESMPKLLEDLLRHNGRLKLVSLRTLPRAAIVVPTSSTAAAPNNDTAAADGSTPTITTAKPAAADVSMYKHGVELTIEGHYLDVLAYLDEVEKLPWKMYWSHLHMDSNAESTPVFRFVIYTLGLDETWLTI